MNNLDNIIVPAIINIGSTVIRGYQIINHNQSSVKNPYQDKVPQEVDQDPEIYRSLLNTPVLSNLTFRGGSYIDNTGVEKTFTSVTLDAVLISVSQAKKIITTEIQGRDGTVKEYIGMDDYHIAISGVITGPNGKRPVEDVRDLKNMLDCPTEIGVISSFLNNLDITDIVISDYELPQQEGGYSYQQFTINALSDRIVEIKIKNV